MRKTVQGFTLIELLVAVSILAILSAVGLVSFQTVRNRALDAKVKADLDSIKKAYEQNFDPSANGGQGGYKALSPSQFANNTIPSQPNGSPYPCSVGPDPSCWVNPSTAPGLANQGYKISGNLSDGTTSTVTSTAGTLSQNMTSCDPTGSLVNGLVGWWKMDEISAPYLDSSGNNNSGAWNGNTSVNGKFGKAGSFNGTNQYIAFGNILNDKLNSDITLSVWVKPNANPSSNSSYIISKGWSDQYDIYQRTNGTISFFIAHNLYTLPDYNPKTLTTDNSISAGAWTNIVATYNYSGDGYMRIYINGQQTKDVYYGQSMYKSTQSLKLATNNQNSNYNFNGIIDDFRIYNRALSAGEISLLYNNGNGCL